MVLHTTTRKRLFMRRFRRVVQKPIPAHVIGQRAVIVIG
jgi:hypothetical protein